MFTTAKKKEEAPPPPPIKKKKKVIPPPTVSLLDLTPVLAQFNEIATRLDQLTNSLPNYFQNISAQLTTLVPEKEGDDGVEVKNFQNINERLFDINQILSKFVNNQKDLTQILLQIQKENSLLLKQISAVKGEGKEGELLQAVLKGVESTNLLLASKKTKEWNVVRNHEGDIIKIQAL